MSAEVDEFLAHYGVPGMKWGKKKANREILREHGKQRLANSGGSKAKANWKSIGKLAAVNAISNVGATAVTQLAKNNPAVGTGVQLVAAAIQIGALGKTINEIRSVSVATRDDD